MHLIIGIVLFMVFSASMANPVVSTTLCENFETVRFSCKIKGSQKIVSVCSSAKLTSKDGYIQYRFGKSRGIELEFPASKLQTQQYFTWLWQHPYHGFIKELSFTSGPYVYTVFSYEMGSQNDDDSDEGTETYGVRIRKKGASAMEYKEFSCIAPPSGIFDDFFDILPSKDHE